MFLLEELLKGFLASGACLVAPSGLPAFAVAILASLLTDDLICLVASGAFFFTPSQLPSVALTPSISEPSFINFLVLSNISLNTLFSSILALPLTVPKVSCDL